MSYKVAGIDVHKKIVMVVVIDRHNPDAKPERRRFLTMPGELQQLSLWLRDRGVAEVVMESTAQYWRSVWMELEPHMRLHLAQAYSNRAPRGRKHDFKDAERLVRRLIAKELILSLVPGEEQRIWRNLSRMRLQLVRDRVRLHGQIECLLEEMRIKLSVVVADLFGVSGLRILHAIARERLMLRVLAKLGDERLRCPRERLVEALTEDLIRRIVRCWPCRCHRRQASVGLRSLPRSARNPDRARSNHCQRSSRALDRQSGEIPSCQARECAPALDHSAHLEPDIGWIRDIDILGSPLSLRLQRIYQNRPRGDQFYVGLVPGVQNPSFQHERSYGSIKFPDSGFQLLALFRWWNIMQYWAPYRVDAGHNWPAVLAKFIPEGALAKDLNAYQLALFQLIAKANDTHANVWSSLETRPPVGNCALPVDIRFIDGQAVSPALPMTQHPRYPLSISAISSIHSIAPLLQS